MENPKHEAFCRNYIKLLFNGTKAYLATYPDSSPESAMSSVSELLRNPKITQRLEELQEELSKNFGIEMQEIVNSIQETKELAKAVSDFSNALKSDDMLIRIVGGYATEKSKTEIQHLDKNGDPTNPPIVPIPFELLPKPINE